jgi:hypothetical protein
MARPMPLVEPVTSAFFEDREPMEISRLVGGALTQMVCASQHNNGMTICHCDYNVVILHARLALASK